MSSEEIEELQFQLTYYKDKVTELSTQVIGCMSDIKRLEQEHVEKDKAHASALKQQAIEDYKQYAEVRTAITALVDQFDWSDGRGRAYWIKCRHPDLKHKLKPLLDNIRQYHWHYDPNKHQDGFR